MSIANTVPSRRSIKSLFAVLAVMGLLFSAACSSDSENGSNSGSTSKSDPGKSAGGEALPKAFDGIPAPEGYKKFDTIAQAREDDGSGTQLLFTIDPTVTKPSEEIMAEYTALLEKNGYSTEQDGGNTVAKKGSTELMYHSAMDGTITVAVIDK